ncbi:hypothetical protein [Jannaschia seohaensis]|uniref:hypothetical protein n=1 Tax=Jannaschia seohaensis TaxID=475081 RepID=UPI001FE6EC9A|nr:hypothetical protein [Jannaschia seohaensis]
METHPSHLQVQGTYGARRDAIRPTTIKDAAIGLEASLSGCEIDRRSVSWTPIWVTLDAFDAANNRFEAPADGTPLFGATLLQKINSSATPRIRGRLVLNGTTEIRGSFGEISATHVSLATAIWLHTIVPLNSGDTVELQGDGLAGALSKHWAHLEARLLTEYHRLGFLTTQPAYFAR